MGRCLRVVRVMLVLLGNCFLLASFSASCSEALLVVLVLLSALPAAISAVSVMVVGMVYGVAVRVRGERV